MAAPLTTLLTLGIWGIPMVDYSTDTGLGLGVMGGLDWGERPSAPELYRHSLELSLYGTTLGEQDHGVWFETIDVAERPVRLSGGVGYASSRLDLYCGRPGETDCQAADVDPRYAFRHTQGYADVLVQRRLGATPWSLMGGWSGSVLRAGVPSEPTPWPDSLYAERFPEGEEGVYSVALVGVVHDTRDDELEPSRGTWADASVRGGAKAWGGAWSFVGGNVTARQYVPLGTERLVSATRVGVDLVHGEQPTAALSETGGVQGYEALGGAELGRGLLYGRYRGQAKVLGQQELRATVVAVPTRWEVLSLGAVGFVDGGWVADSVSEPAHTATAWSTGGGLRIGWGRDFLLRTDVGVSPVEGWQPFVYVDFDHLF